jgi:protein arginine kinase activator
MQKCTACEKAIATIHVFDLRGGSIVGSHHVCDACAQQKGFVHSPAQTLKLSADIFEMFSGWKKQKGGRSAPGEGPACPGCAMTTAEFKQRGRLGCPRCYEVFRSALLPLLERFHDATAHRGRFPGTSRGTPAAAPPATDLRRRLQDAIMHERYEEAARLRDQLQKRGGQASGSREEPPA